MVFFVERNLMGGPISADWHCLQTDTVTDTVVPF